MVDARADRPMAIVLGRLAIEVIRPLLLAGIPCGAVAPPGDAACYSRSTREVFDWDWTQPMINHDDRLADRLVRYGRAQPVPPVLLYCSDDSMVFVSRYREKLAEAFRFVVPDRELVESLVNKAKFSELAADVGLPVPATRVLHPSSEPFPDDLELQLPLILKPKKRDSTWLSVDPTNVKALRIDTLGELRAVWPRLARFGGPILAQQFVEGPESRIESYHVYTDRDGRVVGEFSGRKIRTLPLEYGHTTALAITDDREVVELGRELTRRLDLRGVAKFDFKRAADGRLWLLEINARCNLWHHAGAYAGVNLPALIHADLTGEPRPPVSRRPRPTTWCHPKDLVAARKAEVPLLEWLSWAVRTDTKAFWSRHDPMPLLGMGISRVLKNVRSRRARPVEAGGRTATEPTPTPTP